MFYLHFDPISTEVILKKKKIASVSYVGDASAATVSSLIIPTDFNLIVNNLIVNNSLELEQNGSFNIFDESTVEIV